MNPHQIDQIRDTFVHVLFEPERAATLFYGRLFELAPDTRALFTGDMDAQGRVLIQSLAAIITGLSRFDTMAPVLCAMAVRHVGYGVLPRHYRFVGSAIIDMLDALCVDGLDASSRAAWQEAYALIAETMIAAGYPEKGLRTD